MTSQLEHSIYAQWEASNVAPNIPNVTLDSKTTNSFTVNAVSTDLNGDNLIYKLYVNGTLKSTSASTTSGTSTKLSVTGLSEYTSYNYYVSVSDGMETAQSSTASVRTYCGGTGCNGSVKNSTCTNCKGTGHGYCRFDSFNNKQDLSYWCPGGCGYVNSIVTSYCNSCHQYFEWFLHLSCGNGIYRFGTKLDKWDTLEESSIYLEKEFCLDSDEIDDVVDSISKGNGELSCFPDFHYHLESCIDCNGNGNIYKCNTCSKTFNELSTQHCSHGYTSQHD